MFFIIFFLDEGVLFWEVDWFLLGLYFDWLDIVFCDMIIFIGLLLVFLLGLILFKLGNKLSLEFWEVL